MRDLGTLPASIDGGSSQLNSYAAGINDAGQVAGGTQKFFDLGYGFQLYDTAFITGPNGAGMREIGAAFPSRAHAINSSGQVVGVVDAPPRAPSSGTGFITGPDGRGGTALDIIYPDNNDFPSTAFPSGINDAGQVVGSIYNGGTGEFEHAFITGLNGVGTIELNFMPGTVDDPSVINPTDINNTGEVVGNIQRADGSTQIPFITGPDGAGATDLNSLVHMPAGIVLTASDRDQ